MNEQVQDDLGAPEFVVFDAQTARFPTHSFESVSLGSVGKVVLTVLIGSIVWGVIEPLPQPSFVEVARIMSCYVVAVLWMIDLVSLLRHWYRKRKQSHLVAGLDSQNQLIIATHLKTLPASNGGWERQVPWERGVTFIEGHHIEIPDPGGKHLGVIFNKKRQIFYTIVEIKLGGDESFMVIEDCERERIRFRSIEKGQDARLRELIRRALALSYEPNIRAVTEKGIARPQIASGTESDAQNGAAG